MIAPALDKHASSVSPPPASECGCPNVGHPISADTDAKRVGKKERHRLRRISGRIMFGERVRKCGQKAIGGDPTLHRTAEGHGHFGGVETCGSVWMCPVCAAKITEGRRADIEAVLKGHRDADGTAYMATLTIPHHRFQTCRELREAVAGAWRKVKQGKAWMRARNGHSWIGDVRALEITHGENGWHPHLHVLVYFEPGTAKETMWAFGGWLFDAWAAAVARLGFGSCSERAFTWEVTNADKGAADYVGKWGAALELTKGHTKLGRNGGRTPWQILKDYQRSGETRDLELFREYARSFKGARQLTWSRDFKTHSGRVKQGIRSRYLTSEEPDDSELAVEPGIPETHVATIALPIFKELVTKGRTADVLSALEEGGVDGALDTFAAIGINAVAISRPGLLPERSVPYIVPAAQADAYRRKAALLSAAAEGHLRTHPDFTNSPTPSGTGETAGNGPGELPGNAPGSSPQQLRNDT